MKLSLILVVAMATLAYARPDSVLNVDLDDIHQSMDIADDSSVTGSYSWTSPEGAEYFVRYVADEDGYRVIESNVVPVTADGVRANGEQGSFTSFEDLFDN